MSKLSICIPTYNRAKYLDNLLSGIFAQRIADIEVIVSDNNSTDSTPQIVKKYQKKYKNLRYTKNAQNLGFDANVLKAVAASSCPYCWVIGDDDELKEGALGHVLEAIKSGYAFYLINADLCDSKMRKLQYGAYLRGVRGGSVFDFADRRDILKYLASVKANMGLFGYVGTAVFKRDLWGKVRGRSKVEGLGWIHVYMLWYFKNFGVSFKFLADPLINIRLHNDTVIKKTGRVSRLLLEFKGLQIIASELFKKDTEMYEAFLRAVCNYVAPNSIPPLFMLTSKDKKHWPEFVKYVNMYPYPPKFKASLNSPLRVSPVYFLRQLINRPALRYIKKPVKFVKDKIYG